MCTHKTAGDIEMKEYIKKAVIFDLDGLLIDTEGISYSIYLDILRPYGQGFTLDVYLRDYSGKTLGDNISAIIRNFGLPISVEEGKAQYAERERFYFKNGVALKPGTRALLARLKESGCRIVLATSSAGERARGVLESDGIAGFFDAMVFGPEVKRGKPYPDIFIAAARKAGFGAEDCIVLEDSEAGVQAAHAAGIDVICVPDMKQPGEDFRRMAACVLPSLEDVRISAK